METIKIHNKTVFAFELDKYNVRIKRFTNHYTSIPELCDSIILDRHQVIQEDELDREYFEMVCENWFKENKDKFEIKKEVF